MYYYGNEAKMTKQLRIKGTLHLLLLAITMKYYYAHGTTPRMDDDTLPPSETLASDLIPTPVANIIPVTGPTSVPPTPISPMQAATTSSSDNLTLSFFMHDIFGGSTPSVRVVAGMDAIANTNTNTQVNKIPFSKKRNGIINDSIKKGKPVPLVTRGRPTLQNLLFGTITVIDDELTEGHELGSSVMGKAQGFYLASSMDGSSHTMAFTAMFHDDDDDKEDAISFFGVHRTAAVGSHIAIVGGTGKYANAQGYAIIETLHYTDQYTRDGADTVLQFSVFITQ